MFQRLKVENIYNYYISKSSMKIMPEVRWFFFSLVIFFLSQTRPWGLPLDHVFPEGDTQLRYHSPFIPNIFQGAGYTIGAQKQLFN